MVLVVAMQSQWVGGKRQWVGVSAMGREMTAVGKAGEEVVGVVDCTETVGEEEEEDSGLASLRREPNCLQTPTCYYLIM